IVTIGYLNRLQGVAVAKSEKINLLASGLINDFKRRQSGDKKFSKSQLLYRPQHLLIDRFSKRVISFPDNSYMRRRVIYEQQYGHYGGKRRLETATAAA